MPKMDKSLIDKFLEAFRNSAFDAVQESQNGKWEKGKIRYKKKDRDVPAGLASRLFPYIQLNHGSFLTYVVTKLPANKPFTFLDVGCGAGDKLTIVHRLCPKAKVVGIEIDKVLVRKAKELCPFAEIVQGDAAKSPYLDLDVSNVIREADFLYAYTPPSDPGLWLLMCAHVMQNMKHGATFMAFNAASSIIDALAWDDRKYPHTFTKRRRES